MEDQIRITGLSLKTKGGKNISLTMEEARELFEQLNSLFRAKESPAPVIPYFPPIIIERDRWHPPYNPYPTWYGASTNDLDLRGSIRCNVEGPSGLNISYSATENS